MHAFNNNYLCVQPEFKAIDRAKSSPVICILAIYRRVQDHLIKKSQLLQKYQTEMRTVIDRVRIVRYRLTPRALS